MTEEIEKALLDGLRPSGLWSRIKLRMSKGYTVVQLFRRLPQHIQKGFLLEDELPGQELGLALRNVEKELELLLVQEKVRKGSMVVYEHDGRGVRSMLMNVWRVR